MQPEQVMLINSCDFLGSLIQQAPKTIAKLLEECAITAIESELLIYSEKLCTADALSLRHKHLLRAIQAASELSLSEDRQISHVYVIGGGRLYSLPLEKSLIFK